MDTRAPLMENHHTLHHLTDMVHQVMMLLLQAIVLLHQVIVLHLQAIVLHLQAIVLHLQAIVLHHKAIVLHLQAMVLLLQVTIIHHLPTLPKMTTEHLHTLPLHMVIRERPTESFSKQLWCLLQIIGGLGRANKREWLLMEWPANPSQKEE